MARQSARIAPLALHQGPAPQGWPSRCDGKHGESAGPCSVRDRSTAHRYRSTDIPDPPKPRSKPDRALESRSASNPSLRVQSCAAGRARAAQAVDRVPPATARYRWYRRIGRHSHRATHTRPQRQTDRSMRDSRIVAHMTSALGMGSRLRRQRNPVQIDARAARHRCAYRAIEGGITWPYRQS